MLHAAGRHCTPPHASLRANSRELCRYASLDVLSEAQDWKCLVDHAAVGRSFSTLDLSFAYASVHDKASSTLEGPFKQSKAKGYVAFLSSPTDVERDIYHTMIPATCWHSNHPANVCMQKHLPHVLPPLATVVVERVYEPGQWAIIDSDPNWRAVRAPAQFGQLICVSVSYKYSGVD